MGDRDPVGVEHNVVCRHGRGVEIHAAVIIEIRRVVPALELIARPQIFRVVRLEIVMFCK